MVFFALSLIMIQTTRGTGVNTVEKKSKVEIVYEYLFNEMARLNYRTGDRLIISQIAAACNVSEIPVREALRRLESDGYVRIVPNQGAIAVGLEKSTIANIVQIKGVLEGFATRLSVDYLSANDLCQLRVINEKLREASQAGHYRESSELNMQFHMSIYKHIPQKELTNMISDLWAKWSVTKSIFSVEPGIMAQSYEEHEQILKLIEERRYAEIEQAVREHKFKAMNSWLSAPLR